MMSNQLVIRLFGGVEIELAGRPLTDLGTRKADALLAYLVCHHRPFAREQLAELLWDEREQQQALANLRSVLSVLGRKLQPYLLITRQTVAFNHDSDYWLDTAEFERLAAETSLTNLQQALSLYRGDFLEGFYLRDCRGFEEWSLVERERLQRLAVSGLRLLVEDCAARGRYQTGLELVDRLLQIDNLSEYAHRQKMNFLLRSDRRNAALHHYEQVSGLLSAELGIEPSPATQALYRRFLALDFPPPCRLPANLTPFVGRQPEIAAILHRLNSPDDRLITILGPGGVGKTRLAIAAAETIARQQPGLFLDGIFYLPLAAIPTADALPLYLAEAIGLTLSGSDPAQTQLLDHLRDREKLLVLDNYEHLLNQGETAVTLLATILQEAPAVKLLVTSRERLNLYGEHLLELTGLALPPDEPVENPATFDAVALFLQQAQRVQRNFAPAGDQMADLIRACRLLEGMPLAIELAAGWVRQHTCTEIVAHIQTSLDFLQTTYHNVPPRQRSLRAVFDYSWGLLQPSCQADFACLSIFPDTFTAEAALAVARVTGETLLTLLDKSLLQHSAETGRYQIHPLLRQYATEKLGDAPPVAQSHAAYYLDFLAAQGSGEQPAERAAIRADLPNIRTAWHWTADQQNLADLARVAPTLHNFYSVQSWFQAGIDAFQAALAAVPAEPNAEQAGPLCELWGRQARLHIHIGQLEAARLALAQAALHLPHINNPEQRVAIVGYLAITTFYAGDYTQAAALATESLQLAEAAGDLKGIAFGLNFLGSCAKAQGDYPQAHDYFERAVTAYRQNQDELGAAMVLNNLGNLAQARADYDAAQHYYQLCTDLFKSLDHPHGRATTLANWGRLALQLKEYDKAEQLLHESLALKREQHDERGAAVALVGLGAVSVAKGSYLEASQQLAEALSLAQKAGDMKTTLEGMVAIAALRWRQGNPAAAARLLAFILQQKTTTQEVCQQAEQLAAEMGNITAAAPTLSLDEVVAQLLLELSTATGS